MGYFLTTQFITGQTINTLDNNGSSESLWCENYILSIESLTTFCNTQIREIKVIVRIMTLHSPIYLFLLIRMCSYREY